MVRTFMSNIIRRLKQWSWPSWPPLSSIIIPFVIILVQFFAISTYAKWPEEFKNLETKVDSINAKLDALTFSLQNIKGKSVNNLLSLSEVTKDQPLSIFQQFLNNLKFVFTSTYNYLSSGVSSAYSYFYSNVLSISNFFSNLSAEAQVFSFFLGLLFLGAVCYYFFSSFGGNNQGNNDNFYNDFVTKYSKQEYYDDFCFGNKLGPEDTLENAIKSGNPKEIAAYQARYLDSIPPMQKTSPNLPVLPTFIDMDEQEKLQELLGVRGRQRPPNEDQKIASCVKITEYPDEEGYSSSSLDIFSGSLSHSFPPSEIMETPDLLSIVRQ